MDKIIIDTITINLGNPSFHFSIDYYFIKFKWAEEDYFKADQNRNQEDLYCYFLVFIYFDYLHFHYCSLLFEVIKYFISIISLNLF